ncbi:MAG: hypothetical protein ACKVHE_12120 [Planctomycetales bacterium]|jgi:hypothetical protein
MATPQEYEAQILKLRRNAGPTYGDNVIPAIQLFDSLQSGDETRAFQNALESLLTSQDPDTRSYGVTLCLGFMVFRNSV